MRRRAPVREVLIPTSDIECVRAEAKDILRRYPDTVSEHSWFLDALERAQSVSARSRRWSDRTAAA